MDPVGVAQRLADETLFPAALATDASDTLPADLLDALAGAGLYGLSGPTWAGGMEADFKTACDVIETLASGCLTTVFVWLQHTGCVLAAAASENESIREWVPRLCAGTLRAGLALGGALPGPPVLRATERRGGWTFSGTSPFVSGWGRIDVMHAAARTEDGLLVWAFVDAREGDTLAARRLELVALNATATVRVEFGEHPVPAERVTSSVPYPQGPTPPQVLRTHASLGLGVAGRCSRLLGPTPLASEIDDLRAELDRLDPATIEAARGAAGELALRAAAALAVATGSRSLLRGEHPQRLAREALFCLAYALRPGSRESLLATLTRGGPAEPDG